jgi:UPF0755 protein
VARGDRAQPERTSEERERDRLERQRRRAERAGGSVPGSAEAEPPQPDPGDPLPFEEPPHVDMPDPAVEGGPFEMAPGEELAPDAPAHEPYFEQPLEGAEPAEDPTPYAEDAQPAVSQPEYEAPAEQPPADDTPQSYGSHPEEPAIEDSSSEAPQPQDLPPVHDQAPIEEPIGHDAEDRAAAESQHAAPEAVPEPHATQGYEIPGLPPSDPAPPPPQGLPAPPPRVRAQRETPTRRAFRRPTGSAAATGAGGLLGARRRRARGPWSRLAALVALLAVAAAIVLAVHSLKGSSAPKAPVAAPVVKVLIPEGKTRVQIAQIAKADGLKGSYRAAAKRSDLLNPVSYGAPKGTPDLEGFLFPATYDIDRGAPASRLVEEQLTAFQENFGAEDASRAKALGVTPYQLLTVASMVEREAQVPGDRAKIAAVIYNRLKAGMPLGIDASIYYAVEMEKNIPSYTHELTESQLQINSPYNTRTHTGLPPTPISNPGTASVQAAAHPTHASYLYYVAGADGCGEQVFSTTQSAFEANVAAYEAAKQKNGGHPPTCKHK